jgi:exonuclease SbcC
LAGDLAAQAGTDAQLASALEAHRGARSYLLLERVEVANLWCYERAQIDWGQGITVIAGSNGSGKSSLLESLFFALYGSEAGTAMERSLDEILHLGATSGHVRLTFLHDGQRYTAQIVLRRRGEQVVSERDETTLTSERGESWVGVREVVAQIETLFGLSRDDFVNCLYVRQGEIDRLIRAGDEERKQMIDRLLRLEKLDAYARRVKGGAQRAVNRELGGLQRGQKELKKNIEALEALQLEAKRLELDKQIQIGQQEIRDLESNITDVEQLRANYEEKLQRFDQLVKEITQAQKEMLGKDQKLKELTKRLEELDKERERLLQRYREIEKMLSTGARALDLSAPEILDSLRNAEAFEQVALLPGELVRCKAQLDEARAQLEAQRVEAGRAAEALGEERERVSQRATEKRTQCVQLERELERHAELVKLGKCPTCQQPLTAQTVGETVGHLEKQRAQLAGDVATTESALKRLDAARAALKTQSQTEQNQWSAQIKALEQRHERLETLKDKALLLLKITEEGRQKREQRRMLTESGDELRQDKERLHAQLAEKRAQLGNREELQVHLTKVQAHLNELREKKAQRATLLEKLVHERGTLASQLQQLEKYRSDLAKLATQLQTIETVQTELEKMRELYQTVKKELRLRYMDKLNAAFNGFFTLMGAEDSYAGVQITDEYEIQVHLKNGSTISPALLSGGERALINIALRCAIHQVLTQEIRRMPLILDEPTIYLDRERVVRLQRLLEDLGRRLGQVIIVSHETGLVEGADHEYRTEKGSDNVSTVRKLR